MAIELPGPVADFLNFIGIMWPNVNEDKVREFGEHVAQFGHDLQSTHQSATSIIGDLGMAYQGASYEQLLATWGQMSSTHLTELIDGCSVVAGSMGVAADVVIGMKVEAIAELVVLAAEFVADQVAAVATFGIAEAALALIELEGRQLVKFLEQELVQFIVAHVIEAAVGPLVVKVEQAAEGLVYRGVSSALGVSGGSGASFQIVPEQVSAYAATIRQQAETFAGQADAFTVTAASMSFE
ncbi:hypothetical protein SAMN05892883_2359 [Jatrophihabitans sp. GAS493]|uniref:WXG100-like domain-containing protein n=1 Tax=Jatrophihabitans sp. GAS493 TaxID=1907575 RepID=UPI000BB9AB35|nr:hypothetical protein [Jatrophihabitans sp. GAS493]SOD73059.1 hypothetical protein SAMN05892883_2359 [Jatrophihabitans sp. GAS493]